MIAAEAPSPKHPADLAISRDHPMLDEIRAVLTGAALDRSVDPLPIIHVDAVDERAQWQTILGLNGIDVVHQRNEAVSAHLICHCIPLPAADHIKGVEGALKRSRAGLAPRRLGPGHGGVWARSRN